MKTKFSSVRNVKRNLKAYWDDPVMYASAYVDIVKLVAEDVNSSFSNHAFWCIQTGDHDRLLSMPFQADWMDPRITFTKDSSAACERYYKDNLIWSLVKKYPYWDTSVDTREEAMRTFLQCEGKCKAYNYRNMPSFPLIGESAQANVLLRTQRKIAHILGSAPDPSKFDFEYGPGASLLIKRQTTAYEKLNGALDVTPEAKDAAVKLLLTCPGWLSKHLAVPLSEERVLACLTEVPGDRLSFVPKTALTDRPIAIGPTLNVLLQKGIGKIIRTKLKRAGNDLNVNQQRHRELAKMASIHGYLATVDLKNASDMISWRVVLDLLPWDWFCLLDSIRSKYYHIEGRSYPYQKFSAMGNGFTFELESLLFYAVAYCCCSELGLSVEDVSVYGDDVILPTRAYRLFTEMLGVLGFEVNEDKSFDSGPFRESCGGDFYLGSDVRGFYIKDYLKLRDIVRFRNYLYRTHWRFVLPKTWRHISFLLRDYTKFLAGPDDGTDDHVVYDDYADGQKFNFVSLTSKTRKIPRRWDDARVYLLYKAMRSSKTHYFSESQLGWTDRVDYLADRQVDTEHYMREASFVDKQLGLRTFRGGPYTSLPADGLNTKIKRRW